MEQEEVIDEETVIGAVRLMTPATLFQLLLRYMSHLGYPVPSCCLPAAADAAGAVSQVPSAWSRSPCRGSCCCTLGALHPRPRSNAVATLRPAARCSICSTKWRSDHRLSRRGTLGMDPESSFTSDEQTGHVKLAKGTGGTYSGLKPGVCRPYIVSFLQHISKSSDLRWEKAGLACSLLKYDSNACRSIGQHAP